MFARFLAALDSLLGGTSFAKYLSCIVCGAIVALAPHIAAASTPTLSRFTVIALALPGFVLLYAGLGGIVGHIIVRACKQQ